MTQKIKQISIIVLILSGIIFFVGCAANPQKVIRSNRYNFNFHEDKDYVISNIHVTQKGNEFKICGSVSNRWSPSKITTGKVQLLFSDSAGKVQEEMFVPMDVEPHLGIICHAKPCARQTHFTAKVKKELLENSISVKYFRD